MLEGMDFIVALQPGAALAPGESCFLHFQAAALHLFDAATGRRCPQLPQAPAAAYSVAGASA
jgi:hypothetical protein